MRLSSRITGLALLIFGFGLLAWLLYDATSVQQALGLTAFASEAVVASVGLVLAAASLCAGIVLWRKRRGYAPIENASE